MRAELLTIGSELMSGATLNTNAAHLARRLASAGIACQRQIAVSDERTVLREALQDAMGRAELVITTGGLGPTFDDLTIETIAQVTGRPLVYHPAVAATIRRFYRRHHRTLQRAALRQAYLPTGAQALANPIGTAPGMWLTLPRAAGFAGDAGGEAPAAHPPTLGDGEPRGASERDARRRPREPGSAVREGLPEDATGGSSVSPEAVGSGRTREARGSTEHVTLIALPGVPGEMRAMLDRFVLPRLQRAKGAVAIESRTLRTAGIVELSIEAMLRKLRIPPSVQIGLYPHLRTVDIRLTASDGSRASARRAIEHVERALRRRLGVTVYGVDGDTEEGVIGALLIKQRKTLAIAESCTGGLISDRITDVSGSSRYFRGAVIAYHNDIKQAQLGVPASTLKQFGAVSAQTAKRMAEGVRKLVGANVGLAMTGIAGPTGGTNTKPVGLVYLALANGRTTRVARHHFFGDRQTIKTQAAQVALDSLRRYLTSSR